MSEINKLFGYKITSSFHNNLNQHYLHPLSQSLFAKQIPVSANLPLQQTKSKTWANIPSRKEIIDWFLSLSLEDYAVCTKIDSSKFIQLFLKNYRKAQSKLIHLPSSRTIEWASGSSLPQKWTFMEHLLYALTSQPHIHIDSSKVPPKILLKELQEISKMHVFELSPRSLNKQNPQQNLLWFNTKTFHPLPDWVACQIEKNVIKMYFKQTVGQNLLKTLKIYICQKDSDRSLQNLLQLRVSKIEQWDLENQQLEINKLRKLQETLRSDLQMKLMNFKQQEEEKKSKKKKKRAKQLFSEKQIKEYLNTEQNLAPICQTDSPELVKSISQPQQASFNNENLEQETNYSEKQSQVCSPSKQFSKSIDKTTCSDEFSQKQQIEHTEIASLQKETSQQHSEKQNDTQLLFSESNQKKTRRKRRNVKNCNRQQEQFRSRVVHTIINKQLDNLLDSLSNESNQRFQSKIIAFQRVRYFIRSMFPYSDSILFGSNAVGLSLPTSDIDVMLVNLPFSNREELCNYLSQIEVYINSMGWITSSVFYPNAKVPILKLEIDTSIGYLVPKGKQQNYYMPCHLDLKNPTKGFTVKVDIIMSNDANQISPTTQLMRSWLNQRPSLQRILLALKYILVCRGLSQNFKGGIGSYCLFVMTAAYLQHFQEKRQQSDCEILMDLLKFYGDQFQSHLQFVILQKVGGRCYIKNQDANEIFDKNESICSSPLKVIDPLSGKLLSSHSHQYHSIQMQWKTIREEMEKLSNFISNEISNTAVNSAEMSRLLQNQKSFDKYTNKIQSKMSTTVGNIISGKF